MGSMKHKCMQNLFKNFEGRNQLGNLNGDGYEGVDRIEMAQGRILFMYVNELSISIQAGTFMTNV